MSLVMPNPAAEFSALAITQSARWCSTSAARPLRNSSRPGRPMMSPMNRMIIQEFPRHPGPARGAPARDGRSLGQHHGQFAGAQRGAGAVHIKRAVDPHHSREPAEIALHQVVGQRVGRRVGHFLARDHYYALAEQHPQRRGRHAGRVHHELDGLVGFEDVYEGAAGARDCTGAAVAPLGQFIEELANIVGQVAPFALLDEGKLGHRPQSYGGLRSSVFGLRLALDLRPGATGTPKTEDRQTI